MSELGLRESQLEMASYLRNPESSPPPPGIEQRRLDIYQRLVYNNIEGFISNGFPVLRSLYEDEAWHELVREFIDNHRCHTPYFLEISQEFIQFLLEQHQPRECDPPFLAELAHYEWVELALDVAEEVLPETVAFDDPLTAVLCLSPLAWVLCYQFPVHRLGPAYQPAEAAEPSYLAVYRDATERVRFMELNAVTARLLELCRDSDGATGESLLRTLAGEAGMDPATMLEFGAGQLASLLESGVVLAVARPQSGA